MKNKDRRKNKSYKKKSDTRLYDLIRQELEDRGVDTQKLSITIEPGPRAMIDGQVYSRKEKEVIAEAIIDAAGIDDIEDNTVIVEGIRADDGEEDGTFQSLDDLEEDNYGTEDVFESIEEGEPYTPPTSHIFTELPNMIQWQKKKNRTY